jgi:hypothetical protein
MSLLSPPSCSAVFAFTTLRLHHLHSPHYLHRLSCSCLL